MASTGLNNEPEVDKILELINDGKNFLLSGGAGSGKTYSLISILENLYAKNSNYKIACITFTNVAKKEIKDRFSNDKLRVYTIHDFLWDNIEHFQYDLKQCILELKTDSEINEKFKGGKSFELDEDFKFEIEENKIEYKNYLKFSKGVISHDQIIPLAHYMFCKYKKLQKILTDQYDFIFIDEYQDTNELVIEILLNKLDSTIVGFFGDAMQAIYDGGVGDIQSYIAEQKVVEVQKKQNRRNPETVMALANKFRDDGLIQKASTDENAPNMENKKLKTGSIKFLYTNNKDMKLSEIKANEHFNNWDFNDPQKTKVLQLTKRLIVQSTEFAELYQIYDADPVIKLCKEIKGIIKKNNANYREDEGIMEKTFEEIVNDYDEAKQKGKNKGRTNKDILINSENATEYYEFAKNLTFKEIDAIYLSADQLLSGKKEIEGEEANRIDDRDYFRKYLDGLFEILEAYEDSNINEFLKLTPFKILSIADKKRLAEIMNNLSVEKYSLEEVVNLLDREKICIKDDNFQKLEENKYVWYRLKTIPFVECLKLREYLKGSTVVTTHHSTKGSEFANVLVVLDNGNWFKYNFSYIFQAGSNKDVEKRTKKLFYVTCTRAKENLYCIYYAPQPSIIEGANILFGSENVHNLDQ